MSETALAPRPQRVPLKGLPAAAFQHPLDRQAASHLSKIKGFDWLVKKFLEYGFERIDYVTHVGAGSCWARDNHYYQDQLASRTLPVSINCRRLLSAK